MDLQWKVARRRQWVELAAREGLSNWAVARRAGVSERTVRRWCEKFRRETLDRYFEIAAIPPAEPNATDADLRAFEAATAVLTVNPEQGPAAQAEAPDPADQAEAEPCGFAEVVPAAPPEGPQIQIDVQGGGRVLLCGPLDPQLLAKLVAVLKPC